jgi:selenocysteine-specific elongation factor
VILSEALVAVAGDRFVLRSPSPQVTVGGGRVLDPAPQTRRPDPLWLEALESGDARRILPLALAREPWRKTGATPDELALVVPGLPEVTKPGEKVVRLGGLYALREEVEAARLRLLTSLRDRAEESPESPELTVAEARTATGLAPRLADVLVAELRADGDVVVSGSGIALPGAGIPPELERETEALAAALREARAEPPSIGETAAARLLLRRGQAVRLGDGLLADATVAQDVLAGIVEACREVGEVTLADLRDRLGTSRKYAQAWLEHADAEGVTRRVGDARVLTRKYR